MSKTLESETDEPPRKKNRKVRLLIILAVLFSVILAAGGAAVAYVLLKPAPEEVVAEDEAETPKKPVKKVKKAKKDAEPSVVVALEPFVMNLLPETPSEDRLVQASISLEVEGYPVEGFVKEQLVGVRHDVLMALSTHTAADLITREGKEALAAELKDVINLRLNKAALEREEVPDDPVVGVLFESIIVE